MTRRYIPNPSFASDFLASDEALELVERLAQDAQPIAYDLAPKRLENLADSITVVAGLEDGVATGRLLAADFKAHWYEFGTERHPAEPYLRPAIEAVVGPVVGGDR